MAIDTSGLHRSPWTLFLGCFGADAGSRKWNWRGAYGLVILLAGLAANRLLEGHISEPFRDWLVAISTGAAMGFLYWTMWRYLLDFDELHQRIMLEGIAFSFFVTMTLVVTAGIAGLAGNVAVDVLLVIVVAEFLRGIGLVLAARKYQ